MEGEHIMMYLNNTSSSRPLFARAGRARVLGLICGSMAFIALTSAMPAAPASAQGVPAGLLRLEPSQPEYIADGERAAVRGAYAGMRDKDLADERSFCVQRFRSYDPGSGTYLGHDGRRHPCP
jgi:BA14K-like protein